VHHRDSRGEGNPLGESLVVPPRVDADVVAALPEVPGEGVDVHVLASGINAAEHRQRTGVLGDEGDLHEVTSLRTWSQLSRNRSME
jgi:hypothetical protein